MKLILISLLTILISNGLASAGQEVLIVQSMRIKPYDEAVNGFKSVYNPRMRRQVLAESGNLDLVENIYSSKPAVIIAVGLDALSRVKQIADIPIVYLMVLNPQSVLSDQANIRGISMHIPFKKQIKMFLNTLPGTRTVGLLSDPSRTGYFLQQSKTYAASVGIEVIAREIHRAKDVPAGMQDLKGKIDVFWMLPDLTVVTPDTVEFMLLFSIENNLPLLTFSEKYVEMGAFMSLNIDAFDIGRQAGEMAKEIVSGKKIQELEQAFARRAIVSTNLMTARKIGIINMIALNISGADNQKIVTSTKILN
jgi:putative ABC transport system substrate-binding protein